MSSAARSAGQVRTGLPTPGFATIGASVAAQIIARDRTLVCELIKDAYLAFGAGRAINPHSTFLTFAAAGQGAQNRIIALPACIYDNVNVAGMKWVASFPQNLQSQLPRASAVLVLNDVETGFPFVCMEGSVISAARTAASAVVGADVICGGNHTVAKVGFVGTGLIASTLFDFFASLGWEFGEIQLFDLVAQRSRAFQARIAGRCGAPVVVAQSLDDLLTEAQLIVFATTAGTPYIFDKNLFAAHPRILNISLRDLGPEIILSADNVVDDADHCLRANTSLHLAERASGSREFVSANIYESLDRGSRGAWRANSDKTTIFSPFGMGVLDLALGMHVYRVALEEKMLTPVKDFFPAPETPLAGNEPA